MRLCKFGDEVSHLFAGWFVKHPSTNQSLSFAESTNGASLCVSLHNAFENTTVSDGGDAISQPYMFFPLYANTAANTADVRRLLIELWVAIQELYKPCSSVSESSATGSSSFWVFDRECIYRILHCLFIVNSSFISPLAASGSSGTQADLMERHTGRFIETSFGATTTSSFSVTVRLLDQPHALG
jgi:hypothetical protein